MMACDYFVDALNHPMLELKIQEKAPRCLDAAYKEALYLKMWQQSVKEQSISGQTPPQDRAHRGNTTKKRKKCVQSASS